MKIAIVGAGGVGGYLAAKLADAGADVYVVARGKHLLAIRETGICLQMPEETHCVFPKAVEDDPKEFHTTMDYLFFCVKGYALEAAAEIVKPIVSPSTVLVPLGNGVDNDRVLRRYYPENIIANGAIYIVSHLVEPGVIEVQSKRAYIVFGVDGEVPKPLMELAEILRKAGLKVKVSNDITTDVWKKFLLISAMGTLTSCYDAPMGAILSEHRKELEEILHEILAVGKAEGAKLDEKDIDRVIDQISRVPYEAPTSMWLDFKAGKKTELEQLSGYVVRKAKEHGIDVPVVTKCYERLKKRISA